MLDMRPGCECCDKDLPADRGGAFICSFECTFCSDCTERILDFICPNCGGDLVSRPVRASEILNKHPPSLKRVFNPDCRMKVRNL